MKIAVFRIQGERRIGVVSDDGSSVTALDFPRELRRAGALTAVNGWSEGRALPGKTGSSYRWDQVEHEAPLPAQRRNLFCVGRNYHAHAKNCATPSSRTTTPTRILAHRLHQGAADGGGSLGRRAVAPGRLGQDRLRSRAGGGDRQGRPQHFGAPKP